MPPNKKIIKPTLGNLASQPSVRRSCGDFVSSFLFTLFNLFNQKVCQQQYRCELFSFRHSCSLPWEQGWASRQVVKLAFLHWCLARVLGRAALVATT